MWLAGAGRGVAWRGYEGVWQARPPAPLIKAGCDMTLDPHITSTLTSSAARLSVCPPRYPAAHDYLETTGAVIVTSEAALTWTRTHDAAYTVPVAWEEP